jgi:hypothetical protein
LRQQKREGLAAFDDQNDRTENAMDLEAEYLAQFLRIARQCDDKIFAKTLIAQVYSAFMRSAILNP